MTSSRSRAKTWPYPRHSKFRRQVEEAAVAWFDRHEFATGRSPYILRNRKEWGQNIILPEVTDYVRQIQADRAKRCERFALHRSVHHGLSSQALLFNLIGPLIVRDDLGILEIVVAKEGLAWPPGRISAQLEYEDRTVFNEDSGQPTSIDLVLQEEAGNPFLFVECKFVESEFGGCSLFSGGDCDGRNPATDPRLCYLHHIGRSYWDLLDRHGFLEGCIVQERLCILANHYQFFRCLLFALECSSPLMIFSDERSPTFDCDGPQRRRGLLPHLLTFVPESLQSQVLSISIQQVATAIKESKRHPWITDFEEKYDLS